MDRLRRMEIFVAVAEMGQFSRAADRMGITKSAISHAITALETYLDVGLLQRSSRGVKLTEAGNTYYLECVRILDDIQNLEDRTQTSIEAMSGRIKIAAPTTYGLSHVIPVISEFIDAHPDINISLDFTEQIVDLVEEQIDLAIRISPIETLSSDMQLLNHHEMALYASPDFLERNGPIRTLEHLKKMNCLIYLGLKIWPLLTQLNEVLEFEPESFIETNSGQAIHDLTVNGTGIGYMPEFVAHPGLSDGRLVSFEIEGFRPLPLKSMIVYPHGRQRSLRVRKFVDLLCERIGSKPPTPS